MHIQMSLDDLKRLHRGSSSTAHVCTPGSKSCNGISGAGSLAAAIAAKQILNISFVFDGNAALLTVAGGGTAALLFGLVGALAALRARPAARLRNG